MLLLIGWSGRRCTNTFHLSNRRASSNYSFQCDNQDLTSDHTMRFLVYSLRLVTGTHVYTLPEVICLISKPAHCSCFQPGCFVYCYLSSAWFDWGTSLAVPLTWFAERSLGDVEDPICLVVCVCEWWWQ